ncbi:hypothetical protein [Actinocorallia longicatena]|uniref:Uncharacterized protein n=1 Tax=Actinocorallia longicatena TaxID=111803 RepID=A0ABP6QLU7_9ACTN
MTTHPPMKVRVSSACPSCGTRHVIDLEELPPPRAAGMYNAARTPAKPGTREAWRYRCTNCGQSGSAQPPDAPLTELMGMPVGACGHSALTAHSPGEGHDATVCPGCCPLCQSARDAARSRG